MLYTRKRKARGTRRKQRGGSQAPVPPENAFLLEPYNDVWKKAITNYTKNTTYTSKTRYDQLKKYNTNLKAKKAANQTFNANNKKQIQLDNRLRNLLEEIFQENVTAGLTSNNPDSKAGVVVKFSDGLALYTVIGNVLGFPKGEIEYVFRKPGDFTSVDKETSEEAALRELKEETGFFIDKTTTPNQLKREVNGTVLPGNYTIVNTREESKKISPKAGQPVIKVYYYILELKESSRDPGPALTPLTPNAIKEKITQYQISPQFSGAKTPSYNYFSIYAF